MKTELIVVISATIETANSVDTELVKELFLQSLEVDSPKLKTTVDVEHEEVSEQ